METVHSSSKKICIVGSIASGKTTLAKEIHRKLNIPLYHVDAIQYDSKLNIRNLKEIRSELAEIESKSEWIIDGYGPLEMLEGRFLKADQIVFLDKNLFINLAMLTLRVFQNLITGSRRELPLGTNENNWKHIKRQYKTLWSMNKVMRPEMLKLLNKENIKNKVIFE